MTTIDVIFSEVESTFGFTRDQMRSQSKKGDLVWARHVAGVMLREKADLSLKDAGEQINRSFGAIFHACQAVKNRTDVEPRTAAQVSALRERINQRIAANH